MKLVKIGSIATFGQINGIEQEMVSKWNAQIGGCAKGTQTMKEGIMKKDIFFPEKQQGKGLLVLLRLDKN